MAIRYAHTEVNCKDLKKMTAFYEKVFGLKFIPSVDDEAKGEWFQKMTGLEDAHIYTRHMLSEDGTELEFFQWEFPAEEQEALIHRPGLGHLAFHVDDMEGTAAAVVEAGGSMYGEIVEIPLPDATLSLCYVRDPEGNCIELMKRS